MANYKNEKVAYNGSFLVKGNGAIQYEGQGSGDNNQIATFDPTFGALASTDLAQLIEQFEFFFCVSQYTGSEPSSRPNDGTDLEIGDLWTDDSSKFMYIWDGSDWIQLKTPGQVPVGTVITNVSLTAPAGYLPCDGAAIPPEYSELATLTGGSAPNIGPANSLYSYIKF